MAGNHVTWYAERFKWPLKKSNIIVEGDLDKAYFELADRLYYERIGRRLIGDDLSIFPTGTGEDGGTFGICEHFPVIRKLVDMDVDTVGKAVFRIVALVDGDSAGKKAKKILTSQNSRLIECRDVFVLQRKMPRNTLEPKTLTRQIEDANQQWRQLDCEIEDLISAELVDLFIEQDPRCMKVSPILHEGMHHYELQQGYKGKLCRFVEEYASYEDIELVIEVLRSIRFYLGLNADGI
ncbi:hypothetical protein NOZ45_001456 [Vibrio parahaemolyticus]|nr:hypothetical protein [Vibrio parahaemolyticus]HAV1398554.1 hypothetical protein [Vibrio parahaemolyticus]HAV1400362.1 hypothetical protein [Vibrio parahaemolyticus]HCD1302452.1 hypothetical protein [Vibrio parahaemolyticus]